MSNLEKAAQQALDALEYAQANYCINYSGEISDLRDALDQQAEPVLETGAIDIDDLVTEFEIQSQDNAKAIAKGRKWVADSVLEEHSQQAEPVALTDAEIEQMNAQWNREIHGDRTRYLVRMTEKAHGIDRRQAEPVVEPHKSTTDADNGNPSF